MLSEVALVGRLRAIIELCRDKLPMKTETAMHVVKLLAPHVRDIIRDELADAKREWTAKERQQ